MTKTISDFYCEFIYKRTYARWNWEKKRRENFEETVDRYFDFFENRVPESLLHSYEKAKKFVLEKKVVPSMRALWSAGPALEENNIAAFNCAYTTISDIRVFAEIMLILMNGTGCGFSVERQYIAELPEVPMELKNVDEEIIFKDSKLGWAEGYYEFIKGIFEEQSIKKCNLDNIRPEGAILKTFGGRASGPRPLRSLLDFTEKVLQNATGRKLNSLECHDLVCYIASIVVVGGVRRSATISLSNLSDQRMKEAKDGAFWNTNPQRSLANNSVAYTEKPDMKIFMDEWIHLAKSGSGERGIFNRNACNEVIKKIGRRKDHSNFGTNPCLVGDTKIETIDGKKELLEIVKDFESGKTTEVLTYNLEKKVIENEKVIDAALTRKNANIIKIELDDGSFLELTPDHKIYTEERGWVKASLLNENDTAIFIE